MSIDGTYGFVYCGAEDIGIGVFTVKSGAVVGRDIGGATYSGAAVENADGSISMKLAFDVPAGVTLVQGTSPQELPYTKIIEETYPPLFGDGKPVEASSPPVTVMVKRLPITSGLPKALGVEFVP